MNRSRMLVLLAVLITILSVSFASVPIKGQGAIVKPVSQAITGGSLTIYSNGTVSNTSLVSINNNNYTLLYNLSGPLTIYDSNIVVYGAGHWVYPSYISAYNVSELTISGFGENATAGSGAYLIASGVKSLLVKDTIIGTATSNRYVFVNAAQNVTFIHDTISGTQLNVFNSKTITVTGNTFNGVTSDFGDSSTFSFYDNHFAGHPSAMTVNETSYAHIYNDNGSFSQTGTTSDFIYVYQATRAVIQNINVTGISTNQVAIYLYQVDYATMDNITMQNFDYLAAWQLIDLTITNVTLLNSYGGFYMGDLNNLSVTYTTVTSFREGIYVWQAVNVYIAHSNFTAITYYVYDLEEINSLTLVNSTGTITSDHDFIYTYNIGSGNISNNTLMIDSTGVTVFYLDYFNNLLISNNHIVLSYTGSIYEIVYADYLLGSVIENNVISGNYSVSHVVYGIYLDECNNVVVTGNIFNASTAIGIYDDYGVSNHFVNNRFSDSAWGIILEDTIHDSIYSNTVNARAVGVALNYSNSNTIWNNQFGNDSTAGIFSHESNNNVYSSNQFTGIESRTVQSMGIFLLSSSANDLFISNNFSRFFMGIGSVSAQNDTYQGNIFQSGYVGIVLVSGSNLVLTGNTFNFFNYTMAFGYPLVNIEIYHNNFLSYQNTTASAFYSGSIANDSISLDMGSIIGGNYWSNYTGPFNSNGLGAVPYNLSEGLYDNYPLENPWVSPTVTFIAAGLNTGTSWSITLGGSVYSSTTSTITVPINNGSYGYLYYHVGNIAGYRTTTHSGTLYYSGSGLTVTIPFTEVTYAVEFQVTGLASGSGYTLHMGNVNYTLSGTHSFMLSNGSYSYGVTVPAGYRLSATSGSFTVNGSGLTVNLAFTKIPAQKYSVTFYQSGLTGNYTWSILTGGNTTTSHSSSITLSLSSGLHNFTVKAPSGFTYSGLGNVNVTGNMSVMLQLVSNTTTSHGGYTGGTVALIGIVGGIVGVIATLFVIYMLPSILENLKKKKGP